MRVVLQRVTRASVTVDGREVGTIGKGLVALVGFAVDDGRGDMKWILGRMKKMRVFDDADGRMSLAAADVGAGLLLVSQFTLLASTRKGSRPSWHRAAAPAAADELYREFAGMAKNEWSGSFAGGSFGAAMQVALINDGPVTLVLDSRLRE